MTLFFIEQHNRKVHHFLCAYILNIHFINTNFLFVHLTVHISLNPPYYFNLSIRNKIFENILPPKKNHTKM